MVGETEPEVDPPQTLPPAYEESANSAQAVANRLDARENHGQQQQVVQQAYPAVVPVIAMAPQHHTVIHTTGTMTVYGGQPVRTTCHQCMQMVETSTARELKGDAYIWACILCFFGGLLCCWIPFVLDSNYKTIHKCPVCEAYLGSYNA